MCSSCREEVNRGEQYTVTQTHTATTHVCTVHLPDIRRVEEAEYEKEFRWDDSTYMKQLKLL